MKNSVLAIYNYENIRWRTLSYGDCPYFYCILTSHISGWGKKNTICLENWKYKKLNIWRKWGTFNWITLRMWDILYCDTTHILKSILMRSRTAACHCSNNLSRSHFNASCWCFAPFSKKEQKTAARISCLQNKLHVALFRQAIRLPDPFTLFRWSKSLI